MKRPRGEIIRKVRAELEHSSGSTVMELKHATEFTADQVTAALVYLQDDEALYRDGVWYYREMWNKQDS